jgi:hypothetical protein
VLPGQTACQPWTDCAIGNVDKAADEQGSFIELLAGTATSDVVCGRALESGGNCEEGEYRRFGTACVPLTLCLEGQYETAAPNATADRVCASHLTECAAGQFKAAAGSNTTDIECHVWMRACPAGKYETHRPTADLNRKCASCARGYYSVSEGQEWCAQCPVGTTTESAGATVYKLCQKCPGSQVVNDQGSCATTAGGTLLGALDAVMVEFSTLKAQLTEHHLFNMSGLPSSVHEFLGVAQVTEFSFEMQGIKLTEVAVTLGGVVRAEIAAGLPSADAAVRFKLSRVSDSSDCCLFCGAGCDKGCCIFNVIVELEAQLTLGDSVPITLKATYNAREDGQVRVHGTCGSIEPAGACAYPLFGISGFGLGGLRVSTTFTWSAGAPMMQLHFAAKLRIGGHTMSVNGEFFRRSGSASLNGMTFRMAKIGGELFADFVRRSAEPAGPGPDWLAELPAVPRSVGAGIAFTNENRDQSFVPCSGCPAQRIHAGFNIYLVSAVLPANTVAGMKSVSFLRGMEGVLSGNIAIGFPVRDSSIAFKFKGHKALDDKSKAVLTQIDATLRGGSNGPAFSGTIEIQCNFGSPIKNQIDTASHFSYERSTQTFSMAAQATVQVDPWFGGGSFQLRYERSPLRREFSLALGTSTLSKLKDPTYVYFTKRHSEDIAFAPATHSVKAKLSTGWSSPQHVMVECTFAGKCISATLASGETIKLFGFEISDPHVNFKHCTAGNVFTFNVGGFFNPYSKESLAEWTGKAAKAGLDTDLVNTMRKQLPDMSSWPRVKVGFGVGGANEGMSVEITIPRTADLKDQLPFDTGQTMCTSSLPSKVVVRVPVSITKGAYVELHIPSLALFRSNSVTWKHAKVYARGIGAKNFAFGMSWGFSTRFADYEGQNGAMAPDVNFKIEVDVGFPRFQLTGTMEGNVWIEDAFGISNFGVKGISLTVAFKARGLIFGFSAQACLYRGSRGTHDDVEALLVFGLKASGEINKLNPLNNCFYFEADPFKLSKFASFVLGPTSLPDVIDLEVRVARIAISAKAGFNRCMGVGPQLGMGMVFALGMEFLTLDVVAEMRLGQTRGILPSFDLKISIVGTDAMQNLKNSLYQKVKETKEFFRSQCKKLWYPLNLVCAAAGWLVDKLFNWLLAALFNIFVFFHLKVNVPDISKIFSGGAWPSFALKFSLIGVMFDIQVDLKKVLGALWLLLKQAFSALVEFVGKVHEAIMKWFSSVTDSIKLIKKSCKHWTNGCKTWNKTERWYKWWTWSILCEEFHTAENSLCGIDIRRKDRRHTSPTYQVCNQACKEGPFWSPGKPCTGHEACVLPNGICLTGDKERCDTTSASKPCGGCASSAMSEWTPPPVGTTSRVPAIPEPSHQLGDGNHPCDIVLQHKPGKEPKGHINKLGTFAYRQQHNDRPAYQRKDTWLSYTTNGYWVVSSSLLGGTSASDSLFRIYGRDAKTVEETAHGRRHWDVSYDDSFWGSVPKWHSAQGVTASCVPRSFGTCDYPITDSATCKAMAKEKGIEVGGTIILVAAALR